MMSRLCALSILLNFVLGLAAWKGLRVVEAGPDGPDSTQAGDVNGDGTLDISDPVYLLAFLFQGGPTPKPTACDPTLEQGLPATGQTLCYDALGFEIDCANAEYPGQDGFYRAGCAMENRFGDNGDGTITDACTGLMWQIETPQELMDWQSCLQYCEGLELAGHDDWRLPNILELLSIQHYGRQLPSLDESFGPAGQQVWYWSSSSAQDLPNYGWIVSFWVGIAKGWPKTDAYHVRAVRGGLLRS